MNNTCNNCGKIIPRGTRFCPHCGKPIENHKKGKLCKKNILLFAAVFVLGISLYAVLNRPKSYSSNKPSTLYIPQASISSPAYESKATKKAKSYLKTSAFSYSGLIDQLEYEGFSSAEAKEGVNNCGADWFEQAVKKAKSYLKSSAFSYTGLIDQLEYSGFTSKEAQYGADNCGADWNEQAVKKAKSYLRSFPDWSKSNLIDQLEYSGFTYSQAKYGAENCK